MATMQYYVGTWTCVGGEIGKKPSTAAVRYWLDDTVLRQWVSIPPQGTMKAYELNATTTWDAKNGRYVQVALDSTAVWWVTYGKVSGATETWTDHMNSTGKLGQGEISRTNAGTFSFASFDTIGAAKPNFRVICKKA
jgi:hypothetical protein